LILIFYLPALKGKAIQGKAIQGMAIQGMAIQGMAIQPFNLKLRDKPAAWNLSLITKSHLIYIKG
jgi:hypothetical protein